MCVSLGCVCAGGIGSCRCCGLAGGSRVNLVNVGELWKIDLMRSLSYQKVRALLIPCSLIWLALVVAGETGVAGVYWWYV